MLFQLKATPAEYKAGLDRAIANGWLVLHESGTFVKFTQAGADLFASEPSCGIDVMSGATLLPEGSVKGNNPKLGRSGLGVSAR